MEISADGCYSAELLLKFAHGLVSDDSLLSLIAMHLAECPVCRDCFDTFDELPVESCIHADIRTRDRSPDDTLNYTFWKNSPPPKALIKHPKWKLLRCLGQGGMGVVYLAKSRHVQELDGTPRLRAIKVVQIPLGSSHIYRQRFHNELRAVVGLPEHPHIVKGFEIDVDSLDTCLLLVMEYVPGVNLEQHCSTFSEGRLPVDAACGYILQALCGLDYARLHGVVAHRDLKPENLLLTPGGIVKITDFGLAKIRLPNLGQEGMTQSGLQGCGSPKYSAPEQLKDLAAADVRSDLYSLGCTLYRLLAGHPPFGEHNGFTTVQELWQAHHTSRPTSLIKLRADVPPALSQILDRLLNKSPDERIQTQRELAAYLVPFVSPETRMGLSSWIDELEEITDRPSNRLVGPRYWLILLALVPVVIITGFLFIPFKGKVSQENLQQGDIATEEKVVDDPPHETPDATSAEKPVSWNGWPSDQPPPAIVPFDAKQAGEFQQAWADHFKVPVEWTNSIGMKFRLIPPGEFQMGSTSEEIEETIIASNNDKFWIPFIKSQDPKHRVILTKPLYLGIYEVTQDQFIKVMGKNPSDFSPTGLYAKTLQGVDTNRFPVERVNWFLAAEFCAKLCKDDKLLSSYKIQETGVAINEDGIGYRLPTEAEWQFACRAGTTSLYWSGNQEEDLVRAGWFLTNSTDRTHPVGELEANPFGLFDVHGNVSEWSHNLWNSTDFDQYKNTPAIDPNGPSAPRVPSSRGTTQGGDHHWHAFNCRVGRFRPGVDCHYADRNQGFRVALPLDGVKAIISDSSK